MSEAFIPLGIAVLTVSDSREPATDRSGDTLVSLLTEAGHRLAARALVRDEEAAIVAALRRWIADPAVDVILTTGGTGLTGRDVTPEAVARVATKLIPGFGELFRWMSFQSVGLATMQSRACAALAGTTYVFALPGSTGAVRDAWDMILRDQLDSRTRPSSFAALIPRLGER